MPDKTGLTDEQIRQAIDLVAQRSGPFDVPFFARHIETIVREDEVLKETIRLLIRETILKAAERIAERAVDEAARKEEDDAN